MIVERFTWTVKPGYMDKFIELLKAESVKPPQFKWRIYISNISENDTVAEEFEYENLAELEKSWDEWFAKPETAEFLKKFDECREPGGENTIWNLIEA
jgi:hypothetical protein